MTRTSYFASTELGLLRFLVNRIILLHIIFKHTFQILYQSIIVIFFSPISAHFLFLQEESRFNVVTMLSVFSPFQTLKALSDLNNSLYGGGHPNIVHLIS
jgi:hypothetical protein